MGEQPQYLLRVLKKHTSLIDAAIISYRADDSALARDKLIELRGSLNTVTDSDLWSITYLEQLRNIEFAIETASSSLLIKQQHRKIVHDTLPAQPSQEPLAIDAFQCDITDTSNMFSDIIGCDHPKQCLYENVILPLSLSNAMSSALFAGVRAGAGNVILYGPPGNGKSILVRAAAREANATLFSVAPSDILSKYQGESERFLKNLFAVAKVTARAIIFFDEFDSISTSRGSSDESVNSRRLLSELLLQLSSLKESNKVSSSEPMDNDEEGEGCRVVVVAATNRLEDMDEAICRRFERKIFVDHPQESDRIALLMKFMHGIDNTLDGCQLKYIASRTASWSGSDIECLCREAAMAPVRDFLPLSAASARGSFALMAAAVLTKNSSNGQEMQPSERSDLLDGEITNPISLIEAQYQENEERNSPQLRHVTLQDFQTALANLTLA